MPSIRTKYPQPANEADFELLCLDLLRFHWKNKNLQLYGERGQKQNGVDIFDPSSSKPILAAQCKLHGAGKTIPPREIHDEIKKAMMFRPELDEYYILTTGRRSTTAQNAIRKINESHRNLGYFSVYVLSWGEIEELIDKYPDVREQFYNFSGDNTSSVKFKETLADINSTLNTMKHSLPETDKHRKPDNKPLILCSTGKKQIEAELKSPHLLTKYNREIYINRAVESDILKFIKKPISKNGQHCFLLISPAGCGKTNLFCHLSEAIGRKQPTFLIISNQIRITKNDSIFNGLKRCFGNKKHLLKEGVLDYFIEYSKNSKDGIVVLIDGINEYHDPVELRRELEYILKETYNTGVRFIISCRDYYWGLFDGEFWGLYTKISSSSQDEIKTKQKLSNFSYEEGTNALDRYFSHYKIIVRPEGNAIQQFRHPLLLRFFCETYQGMNVGLIRDVSMKELFDTYWDKKLNSIAERMLSQGEVGRTDEIATFMGESILNIAREMLNSNSRDLLVEVALNLTDSSGMKSRLLSPYGRIIDEYIILEELSDKKKSNNIKVAFVFEEFMEYAMARGLHEDLFTSQPKEILQRVVALTKKYESFSQVFGVVLYLALMLKIDRNIALWPLLITLGREWQTVVIQAFRKLPHEEIDDGVFNAIIDLLQAKSVDARIDALELLKFGRLKRIPPKRLTKAVGDLVTNDNLKIRRRAIHVLGSCPPEFAVPLIEAGVTTAMHRVTDQYAVVRYSIKVLATFGTTDVYPIMARTVASYWHGGFRIGDAVKLLKGREKQFVPLLFHSDILVRIGAIRFLAKSSCDDAIEPLKKICIKDFDFPNEIDKGELPNYFNNDQLFMFTDFAKRDGLSLVQYLAREALKPLRENVCNRKKQTRLLLAIDQAEKRKSKTIPIDFEDLCVYKDTKIILKLIKLGLEIRSDRKWSVTCTFQRAASIITIKPTSSRMVSVSESDMNVGDTMVRKVMTIEDYNYLLNLFSLKEFHREYGVIVNIDSEKWKEYVYRAWGDILSKRSNSRWQ